MKRRLFVFIMLVVGCMSLLFAQTPINNDSLVADFDYFIKLLEATHPDPYSGFGGKVFFHKEARKLRNNLKSRPVTLTDFDDQLSAFIANLQDGHTYVHSTVNNQGKQLFAVISLKTIPDGMIVDMLPKQYEKLLGSKLVGINDKNMDELLKLTEMKKTCENCYNRYWRFSMSGSSSHFLQQIIPELKDSVSYILLTPDGNKEALKLPLLNRDEFLKAEKATIPCSDRYPTKQMSYAFIDGGKQTMMLRLKTVMSRECFDYMQKNGWNYYRQLQYYYNQILKEDIPSDTLKAIQRLPSMTATFGRMLKEMKKEKAVNLIIDLRGNTGGWTPIVLPTLYQLYGDKYLQTNMEAQFCRLISPLYMQKIGKTLKEYNAENKRNYVYGEYELEESDDDNNVSIDSLRFEFIKNSMSFGKKGLTAQKGAALYSPKNVYVITDESTFSAAFHYAFYLWKMGAKVVGVPSSQAPNTFMEVTPFILPYTKFEGSISNTMQIFLPSKDRRAKIFWPDYMPSYKDYQKYNFDGQTEIMYLMDKLK
jgi:hypothetical protein